MSVEFGGNIKNIQWNNRIMTLGLSLFFILGIFIFVSLPVGFVVGISFLLDENFTFIEKFGNDAVFTARILKPYVKVFAFVFFAYLYFISRDLKNIGDFFQARKLELPHDDHFYKILENFCIMRGLPVPGLYVLDNNGIIPEHYVTGAVVQDIRGQTSILLTPAVYHLSKPHAEAFLAQAVQRIYTGDTMFLTAFCFLGYFPYHIKEHAHQFMRPILSPFLTVTDFITAPVRHMVLEMRFARSDVGALELTKEKTAMAELLSVLTPLKDLQDYYHDPYLALFIGRSEEDYRKTILKKA